MYFVWYAVARACDYKIMPRKQLHSSCWVDDPDNDSSTHVAIVVCASASLHDLFFLCLVSKPRGSIEVVPSLQLAGDAQTHRSLSKPPTSPIGGVTWLLAGFVGLPLKNGSRQPCTLQSCTPQLAATWDLTSPNALPYVLATGWGSFSVLALMFHTRSWGKNPGAPNLPK